MKRLAELEKQALSLSRSERERLAVTVWDSLEFDRSDQGVADPEGAAIAVERDREIDSGETEALGQEAFRRLTGDGPSDDADNTD